MSNPPVSQPAQIPYPYIRGAELSLISSNHRSLESDDSVAQVLTSLRSRMAENSDHNQLAINILDEMASQFGEMKVDMQVASTVSRKCGYSSFAALR